MPKRIQLTKGKFALVDDEDVQRINKFRWHTQSDGCYAIRSIFGGKVKIRMHREILNLKDDELKVDHINGNSLDNRKCNLRICTSSENSKNKINSQFRQSKYKGVSRLKRKWRAQIHINNVKIYLGTFNTEYDASIAYRKASEKYHKEYGYHESKQLDMVDFNNYEILPRAESLIKKNE